MKMLTSISIWHPAVAKLKKAVEKSFGEQILPTNVQRFATETLSARLSVDTIRVLWGYRANKNNTIRHATLDILAQYAGYIDWEDFVEQTKGESDSQLSPKGLSVTNLHEGQIIIISWGTNRTARLRYDGSNHYVILEVHNSQLLRAEDEFDCYQWIVGETSYLSHLIHEGKDIGNYQIGVRGGLGAIYLEQ